MSAINRRTFLGGVLSAAFAPIQSAFGQGSRATSNWVGQPVNLARYGEPKSWLRSDAVGVLASGAWLDENPGTALSLADLGAAGQPEVDVGVEWPEFRTIEKIILRYARGKAPRHGQQYVEHWSGLTALQGQWRTLEDGSTNAAFLRIDGDIWTYTFAPMRTCKIRLRVTDPRNVALDQFSVFGPSRWKTGEVRIELGHLGTGKPLDGKLEFYNAELLELRALSGAAMRDRDSWTANAGQGRIARLAARVLYTYGADVDRSIITVRGANGDVSFLPGVAIEDRAIDIPDFGIFVCNESKPLERQQFLAASEGRRRIIDEVERMPEQTLEQAYANIEARRVTLSFVGVDANNHKFGIAPDGHIVVGTHDPSAGQPMVPAFALYFDATEEPLWFQPPAPNLPAAGPQAAAREWQKQQSLAEGWLPILTTAWSQNELSFERTDYAHLHGISGGQESWNGDEPAVLVSRLRITNTSAIGKTGRYYILPWKPATGRLAYGPIPANEANAWTASVQDKIITVQQEDQNYALCYVDTNGKGTLTPVPALNAIRYTLELGPGETHTVHMVIPGSPLPARESSRLAGLEYDQMLAATAQYWKDLRARSMQVEIPDQHLQRIFDATQHHFLLAMTKDGKRGEYYPNTAMLHYGSIGSESSPIIQSLDMRGMHDRARDCLKSWLSTQGDLMPAGDYQSKEGGFFRFWPIYTIDQGAVLWTLAQHYLYTRDNAWLKEIAPQMVAGCDFIIRERNRTKRTDASGRRKPLWWGLAPAGCTADPRDWEYSFMLNAYFYLGLKKAAAVLQDVDPANAKRIAGEAADYLAAIRACLRESIALSPVTRLRDNSSVPSVPSYVGLRGFSSDVKDSVDPDRRHGYAYDCTIGPFHLLKGEVLEPGDREVTWMLNTLEDRFFLFTPLPSRVNLERISTDWFNLGGFEKLQPYYVHYQDAYLQRDQIPNFLRGFYNTLASISDPHTLTFQEELDFGGAQPHKTHEEGWFFHQVRGMLVFEMGNDLFLARGTPRAWLEHGKQIAATKAPTYFGEVSYRIQSSANNGRIEAIVNPPSRNAPAHVYLRLRHPQKAKIKSVTLGGAEWKHFDPEREWIEIPAGKGEVRVAASY